MLPITIGPAPPGGFHLINATLPGKAQRCGFAMFVKMGSDFDWFHADNFSIFAHYRYLDQLPEVLPFV
jgi:hypothetical protein